MRMHFEYWFVIGLSEPFFFSNSEKTNCEHDMFLGSMRQKYKEQENKKQQARNKKHIVE